MQIDELELELRAAQIRFYESMNQLMRLFAPLLIVAWVGGFFVAGAWIYHLVLLSAAIQNGTY